MRARRQSLTPNEKERINAQRREKRKRMTLDERNASQRARRQSLTLDERQERNARQRARRKSLPPEERQALLAQHKESYAAKRDTLCKDSVALQCPKGSLAGQLSSSSYAFSYPIMLAQTSATVQGNSHIHIPLSRQFFRRCCRYFTLSSKYQVILKAYLKRWKRIT